MREDGEQRRSRRARGRYGCRKAFLLRGWRVSTVLGTAEGPRRESGSDTGTREGALLGRRPRARALGGRPRTCPAHPGARCGFLGDCYRLGERRPLA